MAILDIVPAVEVTMCVDGNPLEEYAGKSEAITGPLAERTGVKYIEAVSCKEFEVVYKVLSDYDRKTSVGFSLKIEG